MTDICIVGNPNVGKSTLFNELTKMRVKTGNYEGVTSTVTKGKLIGGKDIVLYDLPGIYSLTSDNDEDEVALSYLTRTRRVICVCDGTCLMKSFSLLNELSSINVQVLLVINMADQINKFGIKIDVEKLKSILGVEVLLINSNNKKDVKRVIEYIESDKFRRLKKSDKISFEHCIRRTHEITLAKIDKILLNSYVSIPIFFLIISFIFYLSFGLVGDLICNHISVINSNITLSLKEALLKTSASIFLTELLCEGVLKGVFSLFEMLPSLIVVYISLSFLEDLGYLARVALIFDKVFYRFGLDGKSAIYLLVGMGCYIPAVLQTREIGNYDMRMRNMRVITFMPCSAKLPLLLYIGRLFFGRYLLLFITIVYSLSFVIVLFLCGLGKRKNYSDGITVLPSYRVPSIKRMIKTTINYTEDLYVRLFSMVFLSSIVLFMLSNLNYKFEHVSFDESFLFSIADTLTIFFKPIGIEKVELVSALLSGFVAKEVTLSSLSLLMDEGSVLKLSFKTIIIFVYIFLYLPPCVGAMKVEYHESRKKRDCLINFATHFGVVYFGAFTLNLVL